MNICIIAMEYPFTWINGEKQDDYSAGGGAIMRDVAIGLQARGHKIYVVAVTSRPDRAGEFYDQQVFVKKIYAPDPVHLPLLVTTFVKQLVHEQSIDIIETSDFNPLLYEYAGEVPLLLRQHVSYAFLKYTEQEVISPYDIADHEKLFRTYTLLMADSISGVSEYIQSVQASFHNIPSSKLYGIVHNGVSVPSEGIKHQPSTLFCHGTMNERKGTLDTCWIFSAVHKLYPGIKLVLIGNRSEYFYTHCKEELDPGTFAAIDCLSSLSREECLQHISQCGIFVSMSKMEAMSLSLLEAMALGKPVVALKNGCFENIVDHGVNGFIVNGIEEAVFYVRRLLRDKALYEQISVQAQKKSAEFTIEATLDKTEKWYQDVLANKEALLRQRDPNYANLLSSYYKLLCKNMEIPAG
ncbi:MAG: glycosyltransferase family 4 protein [Tannerellaceae bacterium]|nr:glycosyltransferase family 4 protein [Tannerellaceae bacterium]